MKKFLFAFLMLFSAMSFAQTQKGTDFVGVRASNLGFTNYDGTTNYGVGIQAGRFLENNFAVVAEVGYSAVANKHYHENDWTYAVGAKYYLASKIPAQVDWNGSTGNFSNPSKSNLGLSLGYAFFPGANVSIEPTLRYNVSFVKDYKNTFMGGIGVNYFF